MFTSCDPKAIHRIFCTGFTENLDTRLVHHNSGGDPHTAKYRPWRIKTAIAFTDREQALAFERYLKSPSGRAFAKKRLGLAIVTA
jgi:predicted GIY-YIG superfamily endonuclease